METPCIRIKLVTWISIIFCILLAVPVQAGGKWSMLAPMPTARFSLAAGSINGKIYAVGGVPYGCSGYSTLEAYDPVSNTWETKAPMPTPRSGLSAGVVNGILYSVGGTNFCNDQNVYATVEAYDPANNTWATKASMPTARHSMRVGEVAGKLYAVGGQANYQILAVMEEYDPSTNTWTTKAPMPKRLTNHAVGVVNGILYVVGGYEPGGIRNADVYAYHPSTDTWTTVSSMPTHRYFFPAVGLNGKLYVVGGYVNGLPVATVESYDPASNRWTTEPSMSTARGEGAVATANGILYAIGGWNIQALAINEAFTPAGTQHFVYVANSNRVSVIDTSTNDVVAIVPVGGNSFGMAISPDGTRAYVTSWESPGSVSVIDTSTNTVVATVAVGNTPFAVAFTPDGTRAYVTNYNSWDPGTVSVIDTITNTVVATVEVGYYPTGVAITPDGTRAYVANARSDDVSVIDISSNMVVATVSVGVYPTGVAFTPDGTRAYVGNDTHGTISVVDTSTNIVVDTIGPIAPGPDGMAITPDGSRLYVAAGRGNAVCVIDTETNTVIGSIGVTTYPTGLAITPDGTLVYVGSWWTNNVSVIQTSTNTMIDTVDVGASSIGIAINSATAKPVANAGPDQTVHVGSLVTLDGSGSSDPSGLVPLTYHWSIATKPTGGIASINDPTVVNPTFIPDLPGDYRIRLVVRNSGGVASLPGSVTVSTTNSPPVADAGPGQAIHVIGEIVSLDGTQSYDPDGDDFSYSWTLSPPPGSVSSLIGANTAKPTFIADVHGTYVAQLVVRDPWVVGQPATVTVSFENVIPEADPQQNQSIPMGTIALLDGSGSNDANHDPLTYMWTITSLPMGSQSFISDPTAVNTSLVPDLPGTYVVQLIVNDGFENSQPKTVTVQAYATESGAIASATDVQASVSAIPVLSLKNSNMKNTLLNKLNAAISSIDAGYYADALDQLKNDILGKTDGCATTGAPDKNDWITTCQEQGQVYPLVQETIWIIEELLAP